MSDEEAFPAVLAHRHWPDYQVRVFGLPGRGLGESWLLLVERRAVDPVPKAVVYGWITDQLPRNYRRRSWQRRSFSDEFLLIEVEGQQLINRGLVPKSLADLPHNDATTAAEVSICLALVRRMQALCATHRVPFYLVAMRHRNDQQASDPLVTEFLASPTSFEPRSLTDERDVSGPYFVHDPHPKPEWHCQVAERIADHVALPNQGN